MSAERLVSAVGGAAAGALMTNVAIAGGATYGAVFVGWSLVAVAAAIAAWRLL